MVRLGWLEVRDRRFVRVRDELPPKSVGTAGIERTIKSVAHKWKLWGGEEEDLIDAIRERCMRSSNQMANSSSPNAIGTT